MNLSWGGILFVNVGLSVMAAYVGYQVSTHFIPSLEAKEGFEYLLFIGCIMGAYTYDIRKLHKALGRVETSYGKLQESVLLEEHRVKMGYDE